MLAFLYFWITVLSPKLVGVGVSFSPSMREVVGSKSDEILLLHKEKIELLRAETGENRIYPIISFNSQSERVVIYIILMTLV